MASTDIQVPSKNPADESSLGGVLRSVFTKLSQQFEVMLPAHVVSYNRLTNLAMVQPDIVLLTTEGEQVGRAPYAAIPVLTNGGGGCYMQFPIKPGDRGWIEASDRDISLYLQQVANQPSGQVTQANIINTKPNTLRLHNFSDGRFVPDMFSLYTQGNVSNDSMVIGSTDGKVTIEINPVTSQIIIRAAGDVIFDAGIPLVKFGGPVQFDAPTTFESTAPTTFNALATMTADCYINTIMMAEHVHIAGGRPSSGPENPS